jgi:hypothetical protein
MAFFPLANSGMMNRIRHRWLVAASVLGLSISGFSILGVLAGCSGGGEDGAQPPALTVAPSQIELMPGIEGRVSIRGGYPPYQASSGSPQRLSVSVSGRDLIIQAVGSSEVFTGAVTVRDSRFAQVPVTVVVNPSQPSVAVSQPLVLAPGSGERAYTIQRGLAPYTATSSDPSRVAVRTLGNQIFVAPLAAGDARVDVFDSVGLSTAFDVKVGSTEPLRVQPEAVTASVDAPFDVFVSGGVPPYRAATTHPNLLQLSVSSNAVTVRASGLVDDAALTVSDAAGNQQTIRIRVAASQTGFALLPTSVRVSETSTETLTFKIRGATAPVSVYSSHLTLIGVGVVSMVGTEGAVTAQIGGTSACVIEDTPVTLTAVDANGAVATSVVTVTNIANQVDSEGKITSACPPPTP